MFNKNEHMEKADIFYEEVIQNIFEYYKNKDKVFNNIFHIIYLLG